MPIPVFLGDVLTSSIFPITGSTVFPLLAFILNKPQFLLGVIPGKNTLSFDVLCKAQPDNSSQELYHGNITYTKKILWLVNVTTTITSKSVNADPSILPIDGTPGGMYDTNLKLTSTSFSNVFVKFNMSVSNIPQFNFVPTTSSLDIGSGNTTLTINNYKARYVGGQPPASPYNSPFANFTTAFSQTTVSNGTIDNNEAHISIGPRNGNWLAGELNAGAGGPFPATNCSDVCSNAAIIGSSQLCSTGNYSVPVTSPNTTVSWDIQPSNMASFANNVNTGQQITLNQTSTGYATLTAYISNITCGSTSVSLPLTVGSYTPLNGTFSSNTSTRPTQTVNFVQSGYYNAQYQWPGVSGITVTLGSGSSGTNFYAYPGSYYFDLSNGQSININFSGTNACGPITATRTFIQSAYGTYRVTTTPNPASDNVTVGTTNGDEEGNTGAAIAGLVTNSQAMAKTDAVGNDANKSSSTENSTGIPAKIYKSTLAQDIQSIKLFDNLGRLRKSFQFANGTKQAQLDVHDLTPGIYYVEVFDGSKFNRTKLLIQR